MERLAPAASWSDLADIQLHIIESYLPCRDKFAFLSINGQTHKALKKGNCFKKYRQHFCSTNEYHLSWTYMAHAESASFFLPSMDSVQPYAHGVNISKACAFCHHIIDDAAPLLPHLYTAATNREESLNPDDSHDCRISQWGDVRDMLNHNVFHCELSPLVLEYYLFSMGKFKKYTTLCCSTECLEKFNRALNDTYGQLGWASVGTSLDKIVQTQEQTAVARLMRIITVPPSIELLITWYNNGIIKDFSFVPHTTTRESTQEPLTVQGHSLLLLHGDCERAHRNAKDLENLRRRERVKRPSLLAGKRDKHDLYGLGRPYLTASEVFYIGSHYFDMDVPQFIVSNVETGADEVESIEYSFGVSYFYPKNKGHNQWWFLSHINWDRQDNFYTLLVLHRKYIKETWIGCLEPIAGAFRLSGHSTLWSIDCNEDDWSHGDLLSDESLSDDEEGEVPGEHIDIHVVFEEEDEEDGDADDESEPPLPPYDDDEIAVYFALNYDGSDTDSVASVESMDE